LKRRLSIFIWTLQLETFIFQELRRESDASGRPCRFFHYRDKDGSEVDLVLERGSLVAGAQLRSRPRPP
jgi:hypothetical protein